MTVLQPAQFNEKFTLYLNAEGKPVQRTLREMTADEVVASVMWHSTEADRLERESAAAETFFKTWEETGASPEGTTRDQAQRHGAMLKLAGEALVRQGRLMHMVMVSMPQWNRHPTLRMADALRRFWPGGRAA